MFSIVPTLVVAKIIFTALFKITFSAAGISAIVGVLVMTLFAYLPGLRQRFAILSTEVKSWIMLGTLLLAEIIICVLSATKVIETVPPFNIQGALEIAWFLIVSNQAAYKLFPQATDVKELVLARDAKVALTLVEHPTDPTAKQV